MEVGLQNKIDSLQVLRFFAAFSVMMVHMPILGVGNWGVDIFFVISGFIMMYVTENNSKYFLLKRIFRIVPLYWILTFGVFVLAIFVPELLNNTTANFEHLIKSLLFIPFNKNETGHFPILFVGWSLNFEIIFYILFAISLFFFKNNKLIACTMMILLFLLLNFLLSEKNFIFSTYSNNIFFSFIYGMIVFYIWKKFKHLISVNLFSHLVMIAIFILITLMLNLYDFPRSIRFGIPSFILVAYFLFLLNNFKFPKILVTLGDASYCIYLFHPYIIQFFYKVLKIDNLSYLTQVIFSIFISIIVLGLSIMIYKNVELPINNLLRNKFITK